ncbi:tetratricopeptide repeat protein [Myxococcota bacterium]|nr:tetratricopeptide repeat protein [Myxococcota bacterium]
MRLRGFVLSLMVVSTLAASAAFAQSPTAEKFYQEGVDLARSKKMELALDKFQQAVAFEPGVYKYHLNLAYAYDELNRLPEALASYDTAMKLGKGAIQAVKGHAEISRRLHIYDMAEKSYRDALKKDKEDVNLYTGLGAALAGQGKQEEGLAEFQKATRKFPKEAQPPFKAANILRKKGDLDGAINYYKMALTRDPDFAKAEFGLGLVQKEKGDFEAAKVSFEGSCKKGNKAACRAYWKIKDR